MNVEKVGRMGPPCFPAKFLLIKPRKESKARLISAFKYWQSAARAQPPESCKKHPWCADCTLTYQKEMVAQERCDHPRVIFLDDGDGFVAGFDSDSRRVMLELEEWDNAICPACSGLRDRKSASVMTRTKTGNIGEKRTYYWECRECHKKTPRTTLKYGD